MDNEIRFLYANIGQVRPTKPSLDLFQPPEPLFLNDKVYLASLLWTHRFTLFRWQKSQNEVNDRSEGGPEAFWKGN